MAPRDHFAPVMALEHPIDRRLVEGPAARSLHRGLKLAPGADLPLRTPLPKPLYQSLLLSQTEIGPLPLATPGGLYCHRPLPILRGNEVMDGLSGEAYLQSHLRRRRRVH